MKPEPVPYITESGLPLHRVSEAEQRGYMASYTVEQRRQVIDACNRIGIAIHAKTAKRAELKRKSRELLKIRVDASDDEKAAWLKELDNMRVEYEGLAKAIDKLKSTTFSLDAKGELVVPPIRA